MSKSDVQAKLKSSIEEKLCSLGAYVDKELPEYILVMIANKKNKELMEKDLQLFLGQDTTVFIDWLHDLLGKCQDDLEKVLLSNKPTEVNEHNARSSQEGKKRKDKAKPKKVRKSDEKKEVKKSSVVKVRRSRSRSVSPRKPKTSQPDKTKAHINTPEKGSKKVILDTKRDDNKVAEINKGDEKPVQVIASTVRVSERLTTNIDTVKSPVAIIQRESKEIDTKLVEKPAHQSVSSTVKVTKRPSQNIDILKPSIVMIQRDIKESVSNHSVKQRESNQIVPDIQTDRRSSVFARLGNTDLRVAKLSRKESPELMDKVILKRTIDRDEPEESDDDCNNSWYRHTKIKKTTEEKPVTTNFIVTLKGAEKLNLPMQSRLGPKKTAEEVLDLEDMIDDDIADDKVVDIADKTQTNTTDARDTSENIAPIVVTGPLSRCKFWPTCKNKDSCPFVHPKELCTNFPNCKFGPTCLYMHPNCRFEPNCSKLDCPFTHHQPRSFAAMKPLSTIGMQQRCVYYPNCTNVNCKYFHPNIPCKFGVVCKAKDTCMFYHPSMPHRTELKWVASEQETMKSAAIEAQSV